MPGRHSIKGPRRARRWLGWAVALLAVLALTGFLLVGADGPADPVLGGIPGYGETAFRVTPAGAASPAGRYCALLADTEAQRARGMMGRRDLAGFDGMLFRFDAEGRFVSATDMAPCPDQEGCPTYPPPAPYRVALEVLQGGLGRLGIGPGSTMSAGGGNPGRPR